MKNWPHESYCKETGRDDWVVRSKSITSKRDDCRAAVMTI